MKTEKTITYFSAPGKENTKDCADIAVSRAKALGLNDIVVASSSGYTAEIFFEAAKRKGLHLVVVTHACGFTRPGVQDFNPETAERLKQEGVTFVSGTHALSGMERAISRRLGGASRTEAIAEAFRRTIAVGFKVAVECVLIAADAGVIPIDKEVIAVGGTAEGADTVVVILPSHTAAFFDLQVREFAAMPRER